MAASGSTAAAGGIEIQLHDVKLLIVSCWSVLSGPADALEALWVSPGRLAFGSAPLPDIHAMGRMRTVTSYQELQICLQQALAAPRPGADAAARKRLLTSGSGRQSSC